jgi:dTDP-4-dehydrorhamnose 3,5-epimerase
MYSRPGFEGAIDIAAPSDSGKPANLGPRRAMEIKTTEIPGVLLLKPRYFHDARGYFVQTYSKQAAHEAGIGAEFVQDNQSLSLKRGTVRALHFQLPPKAQAKLVRVVRGSASDVAVDLRVGSPAYGRWVAATLTARGGEQMFVPRGCAHGFCTLEPDTEVAYKVDEYYAPESEACLAWNDPTLAIAWPVSAADAVLSDKDRNGRSFADFVSPFRYDGAG